MRHGKTPVGSKRFTGTPWYRRERWLVFCIASVLPVAGAIYAPPAWKVPLAVAGGLLMSVSMLLLVRQQRTLSIRDDGERGRHHTAGTLDR